jgi:hypothetical protein
MKKLVIALVAIMVLATACQTAAPVTEAPDDLIACPGGWAYRANVIESGKPNPWPPVNVSAVAFDDNVSVNYRSYIETKSGETRNNIVSVGVLLTTRYEPPVLNLYTTNTTAGIEVTQGDTYSRPGFSEQVLVVNISQSVKPGGYTFQINLAVNGRDYGQLPCTINVSK